MSNMVPWKNIQLNETYYTKMTGNTFGLDNPYTKVIIEKINYLDDNEAMIFTRRIDGTIAVYAVGGKFEDPLMLGPRHRFWKENPLVIPNSMAKNTCAA